MVLLTHSFLIRLSQHVEVNTDQLLIVLRIGLDEHEVLELVASIRLDHGKCLFEDSRPKESIDFGKHLDKILWYLGIKQKIELQVGLGI